MGQEVPPPQAVVHCRYCLKPLTLESRDGVLVAYCADCAIVLLDETTKARQATGDA